MTVVQPRPRSSFDERVGVLLSIRTLSGAGAELVVETLSTGLDPDRFAVTVCELMGTGEKAARLRELGYDVVSFVPNSDVRQGYLNFLRLRRLVASRRIEIIHSHSAASLVDAALCRLLSPRVKIVHTFHFGNYPYADASAMRFERTFWRLADALVAVGYRQAEAIRKTYGIPESRLRTIWNGIPRRSQRIDRELLGPILNRGRVIIGTIGTLTEQKGHSDLLEVAAMLKQSGLPVLFLVVGWGNLHQQLEQRSQALGLGDCVKFLGWVKDAAERVLPAIDIFFQPSRWEAMSMVLLEAGLAGLPIVCTEVGEATRVFENTVSAMLIAPGDTAAMADVLERLVRNRSERQRLGNAAKGVVEASCMAEAMVRNYEQLYLELVSGTLSTSSELQSVEQRSTAVAHLHKE